MEGPSQLEQFLSGQQSEGRLVDTQGSFTIAREEALRKIAEFQLPFENAWVVKLVQCAVADQTEQPIRVDFTAKEARFYFVTQSIALDELETAFYDPEPSKNRTLEHLVSALWTVALRLKWPFQFTLMNQKECLIWDGDRLLRTENQEKRSCTYLAVSLSNSKSTLGWIKDMAGSARKHSELLKTLGRWCFTCPVPLTVDGRRIDSLFNCPSHGISGGTTFPLALGFLPELTPKFPIPVGTFTRINLLNTDDRYRSNFVSAFEGGDVHGLRKNTKYLIEHQAYQEESGGAFLLSSHWAWEGSGKQRQLYPSAEPSMVYWIQDGVVTDEQRLHTIPSHCSAALFLSAQGLSTDLTSFHLSQSPERRERLHHGRQALAQELHSLDSLEESLENIFTGIKAQGQWAGIALAGLGFLTLFGSPVYGIGMMIGGAVMGGGAKAKAVERENALRDSVQTLREHLLAEGR